MRPAFTGIRAPSISEASVVFLGVIFLKYLEGGGQASSENRGFTLVD